VKNVSTPDSEKKEIKFHDIKVIPNLPNNYFQTGKRFSKINIFPNNKKILPSHKYSSIT